MAGLVPAIHAETLPLFLATKQQCLGVDARDKAGHDVLELLL